MSFIYDDKKLIETLVKEGEKFVQKYGQRQPIGPNNPNFAVNVPPPPGQSGEPQQPQAPRGNPPTITPEQLKIYELASKLALGLQDQIQPGSVKREAPLDFGGANPPQLKPENLETLGDFLQWAGNKDNPVMWGGKRIAWRPDVEPNIPTDNAWVFKTYQTNQTTHERQRELTSRQTINVEYYVNKDALVAFLTYLRDSDNAKENKVLQVMLGKIIGQANQYLDQNEQIGPRQDQPQAGGQFDPNELIDGFKSDTLDPNNPYDGVRDYVPTFQNAPYKLFYRNIASKAALNEWLSGMKVIGPDKKPYDPTAPDANPCPAIFVLYTRAKYLAGAPSGGTRKDFTAIEQAYLKAITDIGRQFTFKDDKGNDQACAVTSAGIVTPQQPGQDQGGGGGSWTPQQIQQQLSNIVQYMPLDQQEFSFKDIQAFFEAYKALLAGTGSGQLQAVQGYQTTVSQAQRNVMNLIKTQTSNFSLNVGPATVVTWLKQPEGERYVPFVRNLIYALTATKEAIQLFYASYVRKRSSRDRDVGLTPEDISIVNSQVGQGYSIYQQNYDAMTRWLNSANEVAQLKP